MHWSIEQYLTLNPQKCNSVTFMKTKPFTAPFILRLHIVQLDEVDQFKYLGVFLNDNLSGSPHISAIRTNAKNIAVQAVLQSLLKYVSSQIPFGLCSTDVGSLLAGCATLENVHKFALKLASHNCSMSYYDLLLLCDLPALSTKRLHPRVQDYLQLMLFSRLHACHTLNA